MSVIFQLFHGGQWHDAAELTFTGDEMSSKVRVTYFTDYLFSIADNDCIDNRACSVNAPLSIIPTDYLKWPALLDDLMPVGKSRSWWLRRLNVARETPFKKNIALLESACSSPVGNLRVKESTNKVSTNNDVLYFEINDVVSLQYDFLEYANEQGATVGGATGAGGVAPKLLLMLVKDKVYIDGDFAGKPLTGTAYLTKFARNNRQEIDNDILKAEGVYYKVLNQVLDGLSVETMDPSLIKILEHNGQVSLWLPRFDIEIIDGIAHRLGMESIYSIINAEPGSAQNHFDVIHRLWAKISNTTDMSSEEFVKQYITRDFLNLIFGNSDNHGRNISFIKKENKISFAPIYDFAPMKADPEMVTRLFKWGDGFERGGKVNFLHIAEQLSPMCDPNELIAYLREVAKRLKNLPIKLLAAGCPERIVHFPSIGLEFLESKFVQMGVVDE